LPLSEGDVNKTESVRLAPGIVLYKQPWSRFWYVRSYTWIDGQYVHTASTKTEDRKAAAKFAFAFHLDCLRASQGEISLPARLLKKRESKKRFDRIVDQWIDQLTLDAGTDVKRLRDVRDKRSVCYSPNGLCAFLGKDDIDKITTERIKEMLRFTEERSKKDKLASSTMKRILSVLGLIMKFAVGKGLLTTPPEMPKVKQIDQPRAWFNEQEYHLLRTTASKLAVAARERGDAGEAERWYEMADFIVFMVNAFLRPGEWADLRNEHVEILTGIQTSLKIAVRKGKTKPRYTISMPLAAGVYEDILERNGGKPDAFLFLNDYPNRQTASERMYDRFEILLEKTGLKRNNLGQTRVIGSLRHTALMFRVLADVDLFVLAKNAGTSVDQLERFYCSHFSAEMRLGELHKGVEPGVPVPRRLAEILEPFTREGAIAAGKAAGLRSEPEQKMA
jgi:hypothetical protein